ncbi:Nischarin [Pichia kudriavzevii]|uniref:Nischarin n=1 Tax=Pichia kudriavzevii TaxID=4909 RepID=A0A1V2LJA5_PICKU|nr:Nischarin [Pichia kudriavzevii]
MAKSTCDGEVYIHNLATFIKSHEIQLANALLAYKKLNSNLKEVAEHPKHSQSKIDNTIGSTNSNCDSKTNFIINTSSSPNSAATSDVNKVANHDVISDKNTSFSASSPTDYNTKPDVEEELSKELSKPVRLSLSLHHLYFILGKFKDLGIHIGPMNLRLDSMDADNTSNYVSFLSEFQRNKKIDSDAQSIHSISSVKSVMSSVSALWNNFGSSKVDNTISDLKYLYSAFSKLPCLRLANEKNLKLIEGHEEYPFETATPIIVFKNIIVLEIAELEPKEVYGWHILAQKLRYLVVKKTTITDPIEVLINLVEADSVVKGEDDDLIDSDDPMNIIDNPDDNKIFKFQTTNSEGNEHHHYSNNHSHSHHYHNDKLTFRSSLSSTNIPSSHATSSLGTSLSTSPNNTYHNSRLYPDDPFSSTSQSKLSSSVHSSRRSYYYKPQKKSRFVRGSHSAHHHISTLPSLHDSKSKGHLSKRSDESTDMGKVEKKKSIEVEEAENNYWKLLKHLSFTENKIYKISSNSFDRLSNLSLLDLSYNRLTVIPTEALSKLTNLKSLNLSFNRLKSVEKFPKTLKKLTALNLRGNNISKLDSIENLSNLQKVDLRQNSIEKVTDLKPLLLLNENKVLLLSLHLLENPISRSRGYRVELFNLFNGVDYKNLIKIDGSRPGIFESRMLLDEKTSKMKFKNYIDESIISKMTASVSSMNLNSILTQQPTTKQFNKSYKIGAEIKDSTKKTEPQELNHPVLDRMSTCITTKEPRIFSGHTKIVSASPTVTSSLNELVVNNNSMSNNPQDQNKASSQLPKMVGKEKGNDSIDTFINTNPVNPMPISSSPSIKSIRNPVTVSFQSLNNDVPLNNSNNNTVILNDFAMPANRSMPPSQRTSNDFSTTSSILTNNTNAANSTENPMSRFSLASPALPVITQATTTTTTTTTIASSKTPDNILDHTTRRDYFVGEKGIDKENTRHDTKTLADDLTSEVKIVL